MIDMSQYEAESTSAAAKLREFIRNEVGSQPFGASQLVRAVIAVDPWFGKRHAESVRWAVNDAIRKMLKTGELEIVSGGKRRRVYALVEGEQQ